jgi:adenylate cyclase
MNRTFRALTLGVAIGLLGLLVAWSRLGAEIEESIGLSWMFKVRGPVDQPEEVVVVSLDRISAHRLQLPADPRYWPRSGRALLIDRLSEAGASVIVFDTFLERETAPADDAALADAIARFDRVVLLTRLVPPEMLAPSSGSGLAAYALPMVGQANPIPRFSRARALAPFPLPKDGERLNRIWAFISDLGDCPTIPAVAMQIYLLPVLDHWRQLLTDAKVASEALPPADPAELGKPGAIPRSMRKLRRAFLEDAGLGARLTGMIAARSGDWSEAEMRAIRSLVRLYDGPDSRHLNLYGFPGRIRTISYADIVAPRPDSQRLDLAGKAVFVGNADPSSAYNADSHRTAFSLADGTDISGVEIGATAFVNLIRGNDLRMPGTAERSVAVLVCGLVFGLAAYLLPVPAALAFVVVAGSLYFAGAFSMFTQLGLWPPVAVPLLVQLPMALLGGLLWQQRNINRGLHVYLPAQVADRLRTSPVDFHLIDRPIYGVCLATDVQGYTTLSEAVSPSTLAALMNDYFDALFEPVIRRDGMVTGIAGDGVMSVWASAAPDMLIRGQAALASLDIMRRVDAFNELNAPRTMPTRFGLHAGWMVLGNVGGAGHFAYNAVGDIPNTASRIENLNKHLGTRILATEEAAAGIRHLLLRRIGGFRLMGKVNPLSIYEILCPLSASQDPDRLRCEAYAEALEIFEQGRWAEAERGFSSLLAEFPGDGPARYLLNQCRQRLSCPPGEADTVIRLASK